MESVRDRLKKVVQIGIGVVQIISVTQSVHVVHSNSIRYIDIIMGTVIHLYHYLRVKSHLTQWEIFVIATIFAGNDIEVQSTKNICLFGLTERIPLFCLLCMIKSPRIEHVSHIHRSIK